MVVNVARFIVATDSNEIPHHLYVYGVTNQEILSKLQCQDRIHSNASCINCFQDCKSSWSSLFMWNTRSLHQPATAFWWVLHTQSKWVPFEPARTQDSVLSIWCVRSHVHTPAHSPLVWCIQKIACITSVYGTYCLGHWNVKNERKIENIKLNSWSLFFNIC